MLFADPEEIEALARSLDDKADDVRSSRTSFERRVTEVRWQSDGAERYRTQCAGLASDIGTNAQELNDAADLLRAHAQNVRDRIAWMHSMFESLRNEAEEAWDGATHAAGEVFEWGEDKAEGAWNTVKGWL